MIQQWCQKSIKILTKICSIFISARDRIEAGTWSLDAHLSRRTWPAFWSMHSTSRTTSCLPSLDASASASPCIRARVRPWITLDWRILLVDQAMQAHMLQPCMSTPSIHHLSTADRSWITSDVACIVPSIVRVTSGRSNNVRPSDPSIDLHELGLKIG
jgi:hypothetical protein